MPPNTTTGATTPTKVVSPHSTAKQTSRVANVEPTRQANTAQQENSMPTVVVHKARDEYDVYIGRPSRWGNPFVIGRDNTRTEVIEKYKQWFKTQPQLMADVGSLRGKRLACWCAPNACHGDVLKHYADRTP